MPDQANGCMADRTFNKREVGSLGGTAELCGEFLGRFDRLLAGVDLIMLRNGRHVRIFSL